MDLKFFGKKISLNQKKSDFQSGFWSVFSFFVLFLSVSPDVLSVSPDVLPLSPGADRVHGELKIERLEAGGNWFDQRPETLTPDRKVSLDFSGGWILSHSDKRFGGFSALEIFKGNLITVSDRGYFLDLGSVENWMDPGRPLDKAAREAVSWFPVPIDKTALKNRGAETDAESLALDREGNLLVSFEREHRIQRHRNLSSKPQTLEVPPDLVRPALLNFGIEAMTRLQDGKIFVALEKIRREGGFRAYLISGARGEKQIPMVYEAEEDWLTSAAATLPNGDVLLIERKFGLSLFGFRSRFVMLPLEQIRKAARLGSPGRLKPLVLFTFPFSSVCSDNLEGLTLRENADGSIDLWAMTDDNFSLFQQTRLLKFRLHMTNRKSDT